MINSIRDSYQTPVFAQSTFLLGGIDTVTAHFLIPEEMNLIKSTSDLGWLSRCFCFATYAGQHELVNSANSKYSYYTKYCYYVSNEYLYLVNLYDSSKFYTSAVNIIRYSNNWGVDISWEIPSSDTAGLSTNGGFNVCGFILQSA